MWLRVSRAPSAEGWQRWLKGPLNDEAGEVKTFLAEDFSASAQNSTGRDEVAPFFVLFRGQLCVSLDGVVQCFHVMLSPSLCYDDVAWIG
jgi:hypothetical protein